ncbi:MAG: N-6 DNA methylase [Rhodospirillales bacterium]
MANIEIARIYLKAITDNLATGQATEHTHRPALKAFIEALGDGISALNEPKQESFGAPDYVVQRKSLPLGHIEAKDMNKELDSIETTEQLTRYREALPNLILTNYQEFRWYVFGEHRLTADLTDGSDESCESVVELIIAFFDVKVPTIKSPQRLAERMAGLARLKRNIILTVFDKETTEGPLHEQLRGFRQVLIETLSVEEFADMYAQTICYGLFAARCNHDPSKPFTREGAAYELPKTNPFLREIFSHVAGPDLDERVTWAVDDLAELLNKADIDRILEDFGKRTRREDPVVHFYETFLAAYDPKMREMRGVYYTPEPVVSYIVRSVDYILKTDFDLEDGLADIATVKVPKALTGGRTHVPKVTILDPAVGTGTFLHEVIDHIREHQEKKGQAGAWSSYVSQFLLPRLFGFEILMAPYAVCHLKLGLQLAETGYDFKANERLRVYLTNTLEEAHEMANLPLFAQALAREAAEAGEAKQDHPVMVVLGNPPYSGHSANKGQWIHKLLRGEDIITDEKTENYFEFEGRPIGERNPKYLNDDYVKFIRFAQWRIERTGYGILAFISNHGYLDNPTFNGMRESLLSTFDDIHLIDLHGSTKKKEKAPDGTKDENVFDIQQGVAIGIFVKKRNGKKKKQANVYHADLWGTRETWGGEGSDQKLMGGKYWWLNKSDLVTTKFKKITPESPWLLFKPISGTIYPEYMSSISMNRAGIAGGWLM